MPHTLLLLVLVLLTSLASVSALDHATAIRDADISGGIIVQVGNDNLSLQELGPTYHVRLLLAEAEAVARTRTRIREAGLAGRLTVSQWNGGALPFARRVVNALILADANAVEVAERSRVLAPRGLLITPAGSERQPVPATLDDWGHHLYNASGNAVSKDTEVASPRSFRWNATPRHLRSHNYGSSFLNLVSAGGRIYHLLDEGTFLLDQGGIAERWSLIARDAFNGALLWKKPLSGYGQPSFEDVAGQAVRDHIWRSPLSINRRVVAVGDRVFAALAYREAALSILDAATGAVLHEIALGGVDEIIADESLVLCRIRPEIPAPTEEMRGKNSWKTQKELKAKGFKDPLDELRSRVLDRLRAGPDETIAAIDPETGSERWRVTTGPIAVQSLAMAEGLILFHDYENLIALNASDGSERWRVAQPVVQRNRFAQRNLLGNLLIAEGKVLWTSSNTGGGICLDLQTGTELWTDQRQGTTGGFGMPTALRAIEGTVYRDNMNAISLDDGQRASGPDIGDMLKRGHHIRCFPGKATERFVITPQRGAEFIDLQGDEHMVNDWLRGTCSLGHTPANGLLYVGPDPCSCYAGARIYGFSALAATEPVGLATAPAAADAVRLSRGPAFADQAPGEPRGWYMLRGGAKRLARSPDPLSAGIQAAWSSPIGGDLTQATSSAGRAYVVRKDRYELHCLDLASGDTLWRQSFAGALDCPPTVVGTRLYLGSGDGRVHCLQASDGAMIWSYLAAPLDRLTLSEDRLENIWPVGSSVLYQDGLIYAVAGRCSYLDGGIRVVALDAGSGALRHSCDLAGPWPDLETLTGGVTDDRDRQMAKKKGGAVLEDTLAEIREQYATGYHLKGAEADLLVSDGKDLYMMQNKFDPQLGQIPLERAIYTGYTPMGANHMIASAGFTNDTMFHRIFMVYDDAWPSYGSGSGGSARGGTVVAIGAERGYAAQHFLRGGYSNHSPGQANILLADSLEAENLPPDLMDKETRNKFQHWLLGKAYGRNSEPLWQTKTPVIVRSILCADDGQGRELVFSAGVIEGKTADEWERSLYWQGPGTLQIHDGASGELLSELELPAAPVFDGLSAADRTLLVPLVDGSLQAFTMP